MRNILGELRFNIILIIVYLRKTVPSRSEPLCKYGFVKTKVKHLKIASLLMKRKYLIGTITALMVLGGCQERADFDPTAYVNPFIGTGGHGHTFPGAAFPFGMVQPGPDTRTEGWDACSGYHYSDSVILGFSQTHLSGTGCADCTDFLIYPSVNKIRTEGDSLSLIPHRFHHKDESASPGYYSVTFADSPIKTEITTARRTALYRFTFKGGQERIIAMDLKHATGETTVLKSEWKALPDNEIEGMRITSGFMEDGRCAHFNARFSENVAKVTKVSDSQVILDFNADVDEILVAIGFSVVSTKNARLNSVTEIPDLDFEKVHESTARAWKEQLSRVKINQGSDRDLTVFYTSMYHASLAPSVNSDVNGEYRSHNGDTDLVENGKTYYSTLSFWDIFRAWLPLNSLINQKLINDISYSSLKMYEDTGELPLWPLANGETYCMIGYHSIPFLAEAYLDGYSTFDPDKALDAMVVSSSKNRKYSEDYIKYGYVPSNGRKESVSITLEYAYDDWCIAKMAERLGRDSVAREYFARSESYKNLFDQSTRFFRGKNEDGSWAGGFNIYGANKDFTEATPWHYRFFVPHDVEGLKNLFGDNSITDALDSLFTAENPISDTGISDVTGFYGLYAHGNEPSHHMAYLYDYLGQPWKTQRLTRDLLRQMYDDTPDGIAGNEDCGQMSAWYILSSLGLYEACPSSGEYCLTTPLFKDATVLLANGKVLRITADHPSMDYIKSVTFNGKEIDRNIITYNEIMEGGTLSFKLSREPHIERTGI